MPRGGSKRGEHRGNAKARDDSPNNILHRMVTQPAPPSSPRKRAKNVDEEIFISQVIHGVRSAEDLSPKQVMLENMHFFQNRAYEFEAQAIVKAREPDSAEAVSALKQEVERNRRIASDEAYKVAPFIHARMAAVAVFSDGSHGDDIVQIMLDAIDAKNREHPMVIEHVPGKKAG
jgi:hypothetical protein